MACSAYDSYISAIQKGDIDIDVDTFKVMLIDTADYTYDVAHDFLSDVPAAARVATATLAGVTIVGRAFDANDVTFTAVSGDVSEALIIYKDSGVEATSQLIYFSDTASNLPVTPNGGDITVTWDSGVDRIFSL